MSWLQSWFYSLGKALGGALRWGRDGGRAPRGRATEGEPKQTRRAPRAKSLTADPTALKAKREDDKSRATQEYEAEIEATREKSARLKELRLAKEAADREAADRKAATKKRPAAGKRSRPAKKG